MDLNELRTVQSKERSKDSLQHLRESFYADVADYVADLRERRDRAADRADDPFADPEVNRLTDEIQTAEEVVEGIYERRVGKVVKRASLAAMGVAADAEGLTAEEQELFDRLVDRIETNKQEVLDVLAGDDSARADSTPAADSASPAAPDPGDAPVPSDEADRDEVGATNASADADVSPADVMGGEGPGAATGADTQDATGQSPPANAPADGDPTDARPSAEASTAADAAREAAPDPGSEADASTASGDSATDEESATDEDADPLAGLDERTTVRITDDVGEIFGVDERTYDLASEDVVTLPEANAEPLLDQGAAEELE